jgi:diaminohydroxyphosphoribosylaminopyrimidine deaminase/5-amino-6-(5-phosphoribosylamino)uracil reductase
MTARADLGSMRVDGRAGGFSRMVGNSDLRWMKFALRLATRGRPAPNPHVGALVIQRGKAVGFGWHDRAGNAHAEAMALLAAAEEARGATLYVTLEPCNHYGRTAPCVDAILAAGIGRVVVACLDPNPYVEGGGAARLRRCGVEVEIGVRSQEGLALIERWAARLEGIGPR